MASLPGTPDLEQINKQLRASFRSGITKSLEWRAKQLKIFRKMITEGRGKLCEAMKKDLHKSEFEGYLTELNLIEHEIENTLEHLKEWAAPERISTNVLNLPGRSYVYKDPLGVALIMGAWNYPVNLTLLPLVGCLASGNVACIKVPSGKYTTHSSQAMASLIGQYFDPNVIKCVQGDRIVIQACLAQRWDVIFFTGSSHLGKMVAQAAAKYLTPTLLELGGRNPCVVTKSADLGLAAKRIIWGAMMNAGQTCLRPDYLLVEECVADKFLKHLKEQVVAMYSQTPQETEWFGRLPNADAFQRVHTLLNKDAKYIVHGGQTQQSPDFYVAPTLLDFGSDFQAFQNSACASEEIFAPVLPMVRWSNLDTCIQYIQDQEKPLSLYVFTGDKAIGKRFLRDTTSGACDINDTIMHIANLNLPFGGVGHSGMGAYHGKHSFDCFSHKKACLIKPNLGFLDAPVRYPPYTNLKKKVLLLAQSTKPWWLAKIPCYGSTLLISLLLVLYRNRTQQALRQLLLQIAEKLA